MDLKLSQAESVFIRHGVESNFRNDGRSNEDYRPIIIETDVVQNANGSARVKLGQTDVLVGIKAEIDVPDPKRPNLGRMQFFVDCSANASPQFEGKGGDDLANEIAEALTLAYQNERTEEGLLKNLCLLEKQLCWLLYVDVVILECQGGNAFDCTSIGVKCALFDLRLPKAHVTYNENGRADVDCGNGEIDSDSLSCPLVTLYAPVLIGAGKLGSANLLVDATREEEACLQSMLILAVLGDNANTAEITLMKQLSGGSLDPESLIEMTRRALHIGCKVNKQLMLKLKSIPVQDDADEIAQNNVVRGFLL